MSPLAVLIAVDAPGRVQKLFGDDSAMIDRTVAADQVAPTLRSPAEPVS
jgi:MFS transporter, SHS family, sialic acid transporter